MSILYSKDGCTLITHKGYIDGIYNEVVDAREKVNDVRSSFVIRSDVFNISSGCVRGNQIDIEEHKRHRKISSKKYKIEIETNAGMHDLVSEFETKELRWRNYKKVFRFQNQKIVAKSKKFLDDCKTNNLFKESTAISRTNENTSFLLFKELCSDNVLNAPMSGRNSSDNAILTNISGQTYLIPPNCKFTNSYVSEIENFAKLDLYDFVVIDPPWWNKYIRRVRGCKPEAGWVII